MFKFDNTASVKKLAQKGIPPIPKGNESFRFNVGQTVISSGEGARTANSSPASFHDPSRQTLGG
jgi:hypothetical protein